MIRARVLRKLKASGTPTVWLIVARACRVGRAIAPDRRRWMGRIGYALRRAGRWDDAAAAYTAAISGVVDAPPSAEPAAIARLLNAEASGAKPHWYYNLGLCLRRGGDLAGAAEMLQTACQREPANVRWLTTLAQVEEEAGNLAAAATAHERAIGLQGDQDPLLRLRLAALLNGTGTWDRARWLLTENIREHPEHAPSYKLLAEVLTTLSRWCGTFEENLSGRTNGIFRAAPPPAAGEESQATAGPTATATAIAALERAIELEPSRTAWRADLADARAATDDLPGAIEQYQLALREAEQSTGRWVLGAKQRWQFRLEHSYHMLGMARVADPLFSCDLRPTGTQPSATTQVAGFFHAQFTHLGMRVRGFIAAEDCTHVDVLVNGVVVRAVNVSRKDFFPQFSLHLVRKTLALFPKDAVLEVRSPGGSSLRGPAGHPEIRLSVPHGDGSLLEIVDGGGKVDKKGVIIPSADKVSRRQDQLLKTYSRVRAFFEERFERPVFLMYGTLLGVHRDGDFIPDDDDFDAGYLSDRTDPASVKEETTEFIIELVRAGFTVSFNQRGRLFRVQLDRQANDGVHVDLRPLWFEDGHLWAHNHVCLPLGREDFVPVVKTTLRGVPVLVPHNTEAFLRGHYGPGWKVPDPGFTYHGSEVDPVVRRHLARALITVPEYRKLAGRIHREVGHSPPAGRFVSVGSQDLYPLDQFIAD